MSIMQKRQSAGQLKGFLIIVKMFCIVTLEELRVFTKANELPYLICDVSRFFTVPLSIHPICHGSVAVSDHFYIQWKVVKYRKKNTKSGQSG